MATAPRSHPRKSSELRPIKIEQSLLPQHDGSAIFSFGPVSALAAISGPSEVRIRDEKTDKAALHIHYTPLHGIAGTSATAFEHALHDVWQSVLQLHLYPRSLVQLHLQTYACPPQYAPRPLLDVKQRTPLTPPPVLSPHPDAPIPVALKAAHINAITLACLDAASSMRCMVAAASAVVLRKGVRANLMRGWRAGEISSSNNVDGDDAMDEEENAFEVLLDPSPYEESLARSSHVFAFAFEREPRTGDDNEDDEEKLLRTELIYSDSNGRSSFGSQDYGDCLSLCRQASKNIVLQMRKVMSDRLASSN